MRHLNSGRKLNRTSAHRKALMRNLVLSLIQYGRLKTTDAKAKELRRWADRMVTLGKRGDLAAHRRAYAFLGSHGAVKKLFDEIAPRFKERVGGYTRILKLGRRPGDGAEMAILEFIDFDWAHRQAEKKVAAKAAEEKKQSLLERAKKLVSGKGGAEKSEKKEAAEGEAEPEAEKKVKAPVEKKKGYTPPKGRKGSGPKGGGTHGGSPRKTG